MDDKRQRAVDKELPEAAVHPVPLDIVPDEPGIRLGCLELYVRLEGQSSSPEQKSVHGRFAVEEDQRQRVLVHWRNLAPSNGVLENGTSNNGGELGDQTWRVSCAFSQKHPEAALYNTLGIEAVEWLWDGLSALVLSLGPSDPAGAIAQPLFGQGVYSSGLEVDDAALASNPHGVMGFCFEELCRRVDANADPNRYCLGLSVWELAGGESKDLLVMCGEDAASELRFETVRFQTVDEAMAVLKSVGVGVAPSAGSVQTRGVNSHLFVRAVIFDAQRETMAALHFAQVACGQSCGGAGASTSTDRKALWDLLDFASCGDVPEPKAGCRLTEVLTPLVAGNCKAFFLCSVPENPHSSAAAIEAHDLLDLSERASLITAQCTRVQGVRRADFQLAELDEVLQPRVLPSSAVKQSHNSDVLLSASDVEHVRSNAGPELQKADAVKCQAALASTSASRSVEHSIMPAPAVNDTSDATMTTVPAAPGYSSAKLSWAPGSPMRPMFLDDELVNYNDHEVTTPAVAAAVVLSSPQSKATASSLGVVPPATQAAFSELSPRSQPNLGSLGARIAHAACLDECRELGAACAKLRAENKANSLQRKKELHQLQLEKVSLQEAIASFENDCEAPHLLDCFKNEARALRAEAERLREENTALSGARGPEACQNAKRATLHALKNEVAQLRQSTAEVDQGEKRANLVNHCLHEVRARLDVARRRLADAEREVTALQPAYSELGRQIEHSERRRRWAQEELDKLRRASGGLRAEISQLREVRNCVDNLPATAGSAGSSPTVSGNGAASAGLERFAVLQRRLSAAAPQLIPLCVRARGEMEELVRCCRHLEERQRRLQQVGSLAEDTEGASGYHSCNTSVASGISGSTGPWRARSSDALNRSGNARGRHPHTPLNLRSVPSEAQPDGTPVASHAGSVAVSSRGGVPLDCREALDCQPASGRANSAGPSSRNATPRRTTPQMSIPPDCQPATGRANSAGPPSCNATPRRSPPEISIPTSHNTTPRNVTPRNTAQACQSSSRGHGVTTERSASPRRQRSAGSYSSAIRSWVLDRDASSHGSRARSQERSTDTGRFHGVSSQDKPEVALEGAGGALRDLGVQVPLGSPSRVHGMHLTQGTPSRLKSSGSRPGARAESGRVAAWSRPSSRSR